MVKAKDLKPGNVVECLGYNYIIVDMSDVGTPGRLANRTEILIYGYCLEDKTIKYFVDNDVKITLIEEEFSY